MTIPKKRIVRFPYLQKATGMSRGMPPRIERNPNFLKELSLEKDVSDLMLTKLMNTFESNQEGSLL